MSIKIPAKVQARVAQQVRKYQATIGDARKRDINEADTSHLVMDILCDIFGYKKIEEITSEHGIKGTYADLAVKVGNDFRFLVEVKAINIELKEAHVTQVVNYAASGQRRLQSFPANTNTAAPMMMSAPTTAKMVISFALFHLRLGRQRLFEKAADGFGPSGLVCLVRNPLIQ